MLNIIQNTIGAIRKVGESVVRAGLKMWLPFTKAEPLGEELVTNSDFATDSDWDKVGVTISNGKANFIGDGSIFTNINQDGVFTESKVYRIVADVTIVSGEAKLQQYGYNESIGAITQSGVHTFYYTAISDSGLNIGRRTPNNSFEFYVNSVSVEEYAQETPDISGNDNNAILKTGKALQFSGNDSVETSFPTSKDIKTIAFWIYPTHSSTGEGLLYFGGTYYGEQLLLLNHLTLKSANVNIDFDIYIDGVYRGEAIYGGDNPTLEINQWQRVVLKSSTAINTISDTLTIAHGGTSSYGRFKMSDLQVYGAEWTTDDIAYDYANPQKLVTDNASSNVTLNDLHAWWHLSEGDGTIAFDSAPLIGKELVVNGDFSTDSDWTKEAGWNIQNGKATKSGSTSSALIQNIDIPNGRVFQLTFNVSGVNNGHLKAELFGGGGNDSFFNILDISNGSYSFTTTTTTDRESFQFYAYGNFDGSIDNVSIKEVFNIDGETYDGSSLGATYDDAQERIPQLGMMNWSKGSNLIEYSEDITLANGYSKNTAVTLESNAGVSPIGTNNATKMSNASNYGILYNTQSLDAGETYTFSFYVKNINATNLWYRVYNNTTTSDLISATSYYSQTSTSEWVRVSVTFTTTNSGSYNCYLNSGVSNGSALFWGVQLEDADSVSAYRRTNGTAVTDATLISSATDSQKDILGNAVRVKGSGFNLDGTGYGEVLDDNVFDVGINEAFSICGWAKWKYVLQNTSTLNVIFSNGLTIGTGDNFSISTRQYSNGNKVVSLYINGAQINSTTNYTNGDWFYFAFTRRAGGGNNTCTLYTSKIDQNGNWVVTSEGTTGNNGRVSNSYPKLIGWDGTVNDRKYHDLIDDIKFYDRKLSLDEIEQNFNATKSGHNN